MTITSKELLLADECWIALALLHRSHADRASFSPLEIFNRLKQENAHSQVRAGVQPHIYLHNVANLAPNSAPYRMFYRLADGGLRLFRPGDSFHAARKGKTAPERSELPARYHELLDWYEREYCAGSSQMAEAGDPVLQMIGVGQEIWAGIDADAFVRELRSRIRRAK